MVLMASEVVEEVTGVLAITVMAIVETAEEFEDDDEDDGIEQLLLLLLFIGIVVVVLVVEVPVVVVVLLIDATGNILQLGPHWSILDLLMADGCAVEIIGELLQSTRQS